MVGASLADATITAIHTAACGKVEIRCTFCRRFGHLEVSCRARATSTNGRKEKSEKGIGDQEQSFPGTENTFCSSCSALFPANSGSSFHIEAVHLEHKTACRL
jgi:hypothetical protein